MGATSPPAPTSATVAVQVVEAVTATGEGEQVTFVALARVATWTTVWEDCSSPEKSRTVAVAV